MLAPKYDFFSKWKVDHDDAYFTRCFYSQVLDSLNPLEVIRDLARLSRKEWEMILNGTVHIALVCYEKSTDFCHRHLVAEWLCNNGIPCIEWKDKQSTPLLTGFVLE